MADDPKQAVTYRQRAEALRTEATRATHPEIKKALTQMADNYVQLAKMIEKLADLPKV